MKKLIVAVGISALLMGTSALANDVDGLNHGAIVVNGDESYCAGEVKIKGLFVSLIPYFGTSVHVVQNKNQIKVICKLDMPDFLAPDEAVKTNDLRCKVLNQLDGEFVRADSSKFIWTPGDQARLECTYKIPAED